VGSAAVAGTVAALVAGWGPAAEVATMTPREKAAAVVVSGLPAPPGVGGVLVQRWNRTVRRPRGALVYADQEGGEVRAFRELPPGPAPASMRTVAEAYTAGRQTGMALRREGVHVDLAPVLDLPDGPLGARHFSRPQLGVAFARGLASAGAGACAKHFPGLGSASKSTDEARVQGVVRAADLAAFRAAVRAGVPCVMTNHAIYHRFGPRRASLEAETYRLLRGIGFAGVAITDSLGILQSPYAPYWARLALRAGADLVLTTNGRDAGRIIDALVPVARTGELDAKVARVLRLRERLIG
jgi:beta-N-acetylhexosaminidase